jgi:hypothetical protein
MFFSVPDVKHPGNVSNFSLLKGKALGKHFIFYKPSKLTRNQRIADWIRAGSQDSHKTVFFFTRELFNIISQRNYYTH